MEFTGMDKAVGLDDFSGERSRMSKGKIVNAIAKEADLTQSESEQAFNTAIQAITESLEEGNPVRLTGFGTFSIKQNNSQKGKQSEDRKKTESHPVNVPTFSAGKKFKAAFKKR